jgi:hypothetical protein
LRLGHGLGNRISISGRYIFLFATASRPAVGPTQPSLQWVPGGGEGHYPLEVKRPGVKLTTHVHLMPRLRMRGSIPSFLQYVFTALHLVKHRDNFTFKREDVQWM